MVVVVVVVVVGSGRNTIGLQLARLGLLPAFLGHVSKSLCHGQH